MEACYKCGKQEPDLNEITIEYQGRQKDIKVCNNCLFAIAESSTSARFEPSSGASSARHQSSQSCASQSKDSGCFIASSCYSSSQCPEVLAFRRFRDRVLLPSLVGRWFVRHYYAYGPTIARFLDNHQALAVAVRRLILNPFLALIKRR